MLKILKSRTVWTIIALFVVNGVAGITDMIPSAYLPYVNGFLGVMAVYFRISPKQQF